MTLRPSGGRSWRTDKQSQGARQGLPRRKPTEVRAVARGLAKHQIPHRVERPRTDVGTVPELDVRLGVTHAIEALVLESDKHDVGKRRFDPTFL